MSFSMPAFDTHYYVKLLESVSVHPKQTEAQVKFQAEVLNGIVENKIVTKEIFKEAIAALETKITDNKTALETKIIQFKTELELKIIELKSELEFKISEIKIELELKIAEVKTELKAEIAEVKRDIHVMKWMLGFISSSMAAVLLKLFLH